MEKIKLECYIDDRYELVIFKDGISFSMEGLKVLLNYPSIDGEAEIRSILTEHLNRSEKFEGDVEKFVEDLIKVVKGEIEAEYEEIENPLKII